MAKNKEDSVSSVPVVPTKEPPAPTPALAPVPPLVAAVEPPKEPPNRTGFMTREKRREGWRDYDIERSCGHSQTVFVFAPNHDVVLYQARQQPCTKCNVESPDVFEQAQGGVHGKK